MLGALPDSPRRLPAASASVNSTSARWSSRYLAATHWFIPAGLHQQAQTLTRAENVVNAALLSHAVRGGQRLMMGSWVQSPACINVLDMGPGPGDWLLRACNFAPLHPLHADERSTTMEALFAQYLRYRQQRA